MLKCKYDECCWPECDKTCGLVPPGDYAVGSCPEEGLIYHLQTKLRNAEVQAAAARVFANRVKNEANLIIESVSKPDYECACPYGYMDCVYDPGYIRKYHSEWWVELGMPTTCGESCGGKEGGYCSHYDDEDK